MHSTQVNCCITSSEPSYPLTLPPSQGTE